MTIRPLLALLSLSLWLTGCPIAMGQNAPDEVGESLALECPEPPPPPPCPPEGYVLAPMDTMTDPAIRGLDALRRAQEAMASE